MSIKNFGHRRVISPRIVYARYCKLDSKLIKPNLPLSLPLPPQKLLPLIPRKYKSSVSLRNLGVLGYLASQLDDTSIHCQRFLIISLYVCTALDKATIEVLHVLKRCVGSTSQ